jgi:hypothetical protein
MCARRCVDGCRTRCLRAPHCAAAVSCTHTCRPRWRVAGVRFTTLHVPCLYCRMRVMLHAYNAARASLQPSALQRGVLPSRGCSATRYPMRHGRRPLLALAAQIGGGRDDYVRDGLLSPWLVGARRTHKHVAPHAQACCNARTACCTARTASCNAARHVAPHARPVATQHGMLHRSTASCNAAGHVASQHGQLQRSASFVAAQRQAERQVRRSKPSRAGRTSQASMRPALCA